jgi:hypothetical protein
VVVAGKQTEQSSEVVGAAAACHVQPLLGVSGEERLGQTPQEVFEEGPQKQGRSVGDFFADGGSLRVDLLAELSQRSGGGAPPEDPLRVGPPLEERPQTRVDRGGQSVIRAQSRQRHSEYPARCLPKQLQRRPGKKQ